jgi:recombinational DNA repair protein (RecF pathway)
MKLNINQGTDLYIFFENHLQMIQKQLYGEKIIILIILMRFIKLSGNDIQVNQCIRCSNHKLKTISFKEHGMLCNLCFNPQHDQYYELPITKAIHHLFNESYDKLNGYLEVIDFVIKLLSIYIDDNTGIKLQALQKY